MNCTHCGGPGTFRPNDGPPEVCTHYQPVQQCPKDFYASKTWGDLRSLMDVKLKEAVLRVIYQELPYEFGVTQTGIFSPTMSVTFLDSVKLRESIETAPWGATEEAV